MQIFDPQHERSIPRGSQHQPKGNNYNPNGHLMQHLRGADVVSLLSGEVEKVL